MQYNGDDACSINLELQEDHVNTGVAVQVVMVVGDLFHPVLPYFELVNRPGVAGAVL